MSIETALIFCLACYFFGRSNGYKDGWNDHMRAQIAEAQEQAEMDKVMRDDY